MEYKASLDTLAKIITAGIFVLFIWLGQRSIQALFSANGEKTTILIHSGLLLLLVVILFGSWLYAPQSYNLDTAELRINRPAGKIPIKRSEITEVRQIAKDEMKGTIRTFANGGLFGFYGKYYNKKIGHMTFYTTQTKNLVLLVTKEGKKIIISPDDLSIVGKLRPHISK